MIYWSIIAFLVIVVLVGAVRSAIDDLKANDDYGG